MPKNITFVTFLKTLGYTFMPLSLGSKSITQVFFSEINIAHSARKNETFWYFSNTVEGGKLLIAWNFFCSEWLNNNDFGILDILQFPHVDPRTLGSRTTLKGSAGEKSIEYHVIIHLGNRFGQPVMFPQKGQQFGTGPIHSHEFGAGFLVV